MLTRLNRILEIDIPNQRITVEPGVINLDVTRAVAPHGLYYAPDPSSQLICSIGGNVAENSGGAHCLKYGFTVHHVLGVEAVLPNGDLVQIGGAALDTPGLDLLGVIVGSEGTLAVVTKATLRLLRVPEAVRTLLAASSSTDQAGDVVSAIIAAGIIPAAIEMMDRLTLEAAEAAVHSGFPRAEAVLIVELDGPAVEVDELFQQVERICRDHHTTDLLIARNSDDRTRIWKGRKAAFAAMGRVSPNYYVQDGVIPRTTLPAVLRRIRDLEHRSGLRIGNVFHAGDGSIRWCVTTRACQAELAEQVAAEILIPSKRRINHREHGVGADKAHQMPRCSPQRTSTCSWFGADPSGICNPGKVFPTPRLCGEVPGAYRQHPAEHTGVAERW